MTKRLFRVLYILVLAALVGSLAACGGGGGALAPSGGSNDPVTVEIPALDTVADLPFTTGIVVAASGSESAPLKSAWASVAKEVGTNDNPFITPGMSRPFCETVNDWRLLLDASTQPDNNLCIMKDNLSAATAAGVNLLDGNYHIYASSDGSRKYKTKITVNSSKVITAYEMFACSSGTQENYTSYSFSGKKLTATVKNIRSAHPQRSTVTVTGDLDTTDPTQFSGSKSVSYTYSGNITAGDTSGIGDMTQTKATTLMDAWNSQGSGSNVARIYAQVDLTQPSATPFTPKDYALGSGAAVMITSGGNGPTTESTECWDGTSLMPVTCLDSNSNYTAVKGKTPKTVSTVSIPDFVGSNKWDCSGTSEFTITFSMASGSCFDRFTINPENIDCVASTKGDLTVTPTVSGTTLSTRSDAANSVSTTPSIVLTASQALDTSSTNSTTITLVNTSSNESVSLTYTNFNSDSTTLTLSPTLVSGQTYKLTLVGSSTTATSGTVIRAPGATPPKDQLQSTGTYYITAQ